MDSKRMLNSSAAATAMARHEMLNAKIKGNSKGSRDSRPTTATKPKVGRKSLEPYIRFEIGQLVPPSRQAIPSAETSVKVEALATAEASLATADAASHPRHH